MNNDKKCERIFEAIGNADEELLELCEINVWNKFGVRRAVAAVCLCLLAVMGLIFRNSLIKENRPMIISCAPSGLASGIYAAPDNGKTIFHTGVQAALDENAQEDVLYFVAIDLFHDKVPLSSESDAVREELKRLIDCGYEVGYATAWTYQGEWEKMDLSYLAGYFSKEQLENFSVSPQFGYAFSFAANGDGSPVDAEQNLTTELQ